MLPVGILGVGLDDKKRGMFAEPDQSPAAKRMALVNPEYQAAFRMFDRDGSGNIDLMELCGALQAVKMSVEGGTQRSLFNANTFNTNTVLFLAAKFGASTGGQSLVFAQFAEMLQYLESVKQIFSQIDVDNSGDLNVSELSRALSLSGFNVTGYGMGMGGGDSLSMQVATKIGQAYDADGNGVLSFDEFVQMRCEWDSYIQAWNSHVMPGSNQIEPQQILAVLEDIKRSMEPVGQMAMNQAVAAMAGFNGNFFNGLMFQSQFQTARPFTARTAQVLIIRFANGGVRLSFEQFCMLMEFLKEQKKNFMQFDTDRSGSLELPELVNAFAASGIPMPAVQVMQIGQRYDADNSGTIEFDEFLQMMCEWSQVGGQQNQFANFAQQRASVYDLQKLFPSITIFYQTINGAIPTMRPFSLNTCRSLVAQFGSPLPGEPFATGVSYNEFLMLTQRVKLAAAQFAEADLAGDGSISAGELAFAMRRCGSTLPDVAIQGILASHDYDRDGRIAFDEFLQMLLDAEMFNTRIQSIQAPGVDPTVLFQLMYSMPRTLYR